MENCSSVILKVTKELGRLADFWIPCDLRGITTCNAWPILVRHNLMPYSVWKDLALPELTPTCMTLELADRSITEPIGIAKDVRLMVGKFQFPADFVVVDFEPDPRVPLILGRCFLKTSHALIDVYGGEITLRVGKEAITFNLDQTSKYTADYDHMTANKIDVIEMACDEYSQEVLGFSNVIATFVSALGGGPYLSEVGSNLSGSEGGDDKLPVIMLRLKSERKEALLKEDEKLLDAGLIYPISEQSLGEAGTLCYLKKEHPERPFPLVQDQMLVSTSRQRILLFLEWLPQVTFPSLLTQKAQEKDTFTCPYGTFAIGRCLLAYINALHNEVGNPLKKVEYSGDYDSEDEVASVDNDMAHPYDDDMYEGHDIPQEIQAICDNLDIRIRGRKKKQIYVSFGLSFCVPTFKEVVLPM
ncbi:reverse transcriptase domain-containing protein [Tanacetum coccineum]